MTTRRRHLRERGQAVPVIAIMATLLIGVTALMVDLSLQTHNRRALQNLTDAAALAGARELGPTPSQSDRITAAMQALSILHTQLWPGLFGANWVSQSVQGATCVAGGSACDASIVPPSPGSNYTVQIHIPPKTSANSIYNGKWGYVEVDLNQRTTNTFAGMIGFNNSTEGAHSIGYHFATNQAFGFALYANSVVSTGNDGETISGNVYANRYVQPQGSGHAGFCADNGSYIIFGAAQYGDSDYDASNDPGQHDNPNLNSDYPVVSQSSCATTSSGTVVETGTPFSAGASCAGTVSGVNFSGTWNGGPSGLNACVARPRIVAPSLEPPTLPSFSTTPTYCGQTGKNNGQYQPGIYACSAGTSLQVDAPLQPGLYVVSHANNNSCTIKNNCYDVQIGQSANLSGVTFYLVNGATIGMYGSGVSVSWTPYDNTTSNNSGDQGVYPVYSDGNTASALEITNGATVTTTGTVYLPNGNVDVLQNALITISPGQAIVGSWNVQSGYHANPDITYTGSNAAPQREVLKIVE
jgi:Putative Flp pilus-assembly TadE/G-like